MAMKPPTDAFMQFAAWKMTWPGVSTTLTEVEKQTGLSVRGGLMWLIHVVELGSYIGGVTNLLLVQYALSTIRGAVSIPVPTDKGFVSGFSSVGVFVTSGAGMVIVPWRLSYLPPVPIAAPNLSCYMVASADETTFDGKDVSIRVGYTTTPLDAKAYAEIAETWSYV